MAVGGILGSTRERTCALDECLNFLRHAEEVERRVAVEVGRHLVDKAKQFGVAEHVGRNFRPMLEQLELLVNDRSLLINSARIFRSSSNCTHTSTWPCRSVTPRSVNTATARARRSSSFGNSTLMSMSVPVDVFAVVVAERLVQVTGHADVVHHVTALLLAARAIHSGDRLQQVVRDDLPVEVEHLLDGRIESREQHVHYHQDRKRVGLVGLCQVELALERLIVPPDLSLSAHSHHDSGSL